MTKALHIAKDLDLPLDSITSRTGFTGQSESGKSYAATKLAEEMILAGAQVIGVDPVGVWYGLKVGKDQRTAGLPVVVFGGIHQDLPLLPDSGRAVAEVLAEKRFSAVLDVSEFTMGELAKFAAAFAEHFFDAKKRSKGPVCVFWEEAQSFAPQELPPDPHAALMLNRVVRMVKVGRNYGIGNVLITQEPQAVSKRALSQVNCLFIGRMQGAHAKKAIKAWVSDKATSKADIDMVEDLSSLPQGEMLVAEPRWFGAIRRVHIAEKQTFDSSRTPKLGEDAPVPGKIAAVDLRDLRAALATEVKKAEADPAAMQARIASLEEQLRQKVERASPKVKEVPVITEAQLKRIEKIGDVLLTGAAEAQLAAKELRELAKAAGATQQETSNDTVRHRPARLNPSTIERPAPATSPARRDGARAAMGVAETQRPSPPPPSATGLKPSQLRLLEAAAVADGLTPRQLAIRCGYTPDGGGFNNLMYSLTGSGHLERRGPRIYVTDAGAAAVPHARKVGPAEFREVWRGKLKPSQWKLLAAVIDRYPAAIHPDELAEATGYTPGGGGFNNLMYSLTGAGLLEKDADGLRPTEDLVG
jgi:hypothetical protein